MVALPPVRCKRPVWARPLDVRPPAFRPPVRGEEPPSSRTMATRATAPPRLRDGRARLPALEPSAVIRATRLARGAEGAAAGCPRVALNRRLAVPTPTVYRDAPFDPRLLAALRTPLAFLAPPLRGTPNSAAPSAPHPALAAAVERASSPVSRGVEVSPRDYPLVLRLLRAPSRLARPHLARPRRAGPRGRGFGVRGQLRRRRDLSELPFWQELVDLLDLVHERLELAVDPSRVRIIPCRVISAAP